MNWSDIADLVVAVCSVLATLIAAYVAWHGPLKGVRLANALQGYETKRQDSSRRLPEIMKDAREFFFAFKDSFRAYKSWQTAKIALEDQRRWYASISPAQKERYDPGIDEKTEIANTHRQEYNTSRQRLEMSMAVLESHRFALALMFECDADPGMEAIAKLCNFHKVIGSLNLEEMAATEGEIEKKLSEQVQAIYNELKELFSGYVQSQIDDLEPEH